MTQSKLLPTARWIFLSFPLATLIRLYKLLKNSRESCDSLLIDLYRPTSKRPRTLSERSRFDVDCYWWRMTGSNRRPPACKAGALPAELIPLKLSHEISEDLVGLVGLEPTTPALSRRCSNQLSYRPMAETNRPLPTTDKCGRSILNAVFQKGGDPAAPSDTATLLRLHPSHEPCRGNRPPCG